MLRSAPMTGPALLKRFRETGASESVSALLARRPATAVQLTDARGVGLLLAELRQVGASESCAILIGRAIEYIR
jgi:hypothetical protein